MRHLALLRAINVGGRRVSNDQLTTAATDAGFGGVMAYQASGNLVLDADGRSTAQTASVLEGALTDALGFTVEVMVRDADGIARALATPFTAEEVEGSTAAPQVMFLRDAAPTDASQAVAALSTSADRLVLAEDVVHWLPTAGVGRAALDMSALSRALGPITVRSRTTIARIQARFFTG